MNLLIEVIKILVYIMGSIFFFASIFYLITVWNVKKPEFNYDFFPKVSIMAYAWQSGNIIEKKIKNFLDQNYPKDRFEIIIYDNKSTDETDDICLEYAKKGLIKFYQPKNMVLAIAGGFGAVRAKKLARNHFGDLKRGKRPGRKKLSFRQKKPRLKLIYKKTDHMKAM